MCMLCTEWERWAETADLNVCKSQGGADGRRKMSLSLKVVRTVKRPPGYAAPRLNWFHPPITLPPFCLSHGVSGQVIDSICCVPFSQFVLEQPLSGQTIKSTISSIPTLSSFTSSHCYRSYIRLCSHIHTGLHNAHTY